MAQGYFAPVKRQLALDQLNTKRPWPLATQTRHGDGSPLRISDLFSEPRYRSLEIYSELFRVLGFDHQVAFSIPIDQDRRICVAMNRQSGDFSTSELDRLAALRRPVAACASRIAHMERFDVPGIGATACLTPCARERDRPDARSDGAQQCADRPPTARDQARGRSTSTWSTSSPRPDSAIEPKQLPTGPGSSDVNLARPSPAG